MLAFKAILFVAIHMLIEFIFLTFILKGAMKLWRKYKGKTTVNVDPIKGYITGGVK